MTDGLIKVMRGCAEQNWREGHGTSSGVLDQEWMESATSRGVVFVVPAEKGLPFFPVENS